MDSLWNCNPKYALFPLSCICKGILSQQQGSTKTVSIHYSLSCPFTHSSSIYIHLSIHPPIIIKYPSIPPSSSTYYHHPFHPSFINLPPTQPLLIYHCPFITHPTIYLLIYAYSTFPATHLSIHHPISTSPYTIHPTITHSIIHSSFILRHLSTYPHIINLIYSTFSIYHPSSYLFTYTYIFLLSIYTHIYLSPNIYQCIQHPSTYHPFHPSFLFHHPPTHPSINLLYSFSFIIIHTYNYPSIHESTYHLPCHSPIHSSFIHSSVIHSFRLSLE